jgi:hypothetical protein
MSPSRTLTGWETLPPKHAQKVVERQGPAADLNIPLAGHPLLLGRILGFSGVILVAHFPIVRIPEPGICGGLPDSLRKALRGRMIRSVVVRPAAQFLGGGSLRFRREPTDLGAERGPARAAGFRYDLSAGDQFVQPRPGLRSIGLLRTVHAGRDNQHAFLGGAIAG